MLLKTMLGGCSVLHTRGDLDVRISGITLDSRLVSAGFVFVAIRGLKMDGNRFVSDAIARGAAAIVSALPRAKRSACASGGSPGKYDSSMSAGRTS